MAYNDSWSLHDVTPTRHSNYHQQQQPQRAPLNPISVSKEAQQLLSDAQYSTKFRVGKYKTYDFEQVWLNDRAYFTWLLNRCDFPAMEVDRENAHRWLEEKIRNQKLTHTPQIQQF